MGDRFRRPEGGVLVAGDVLQLVDGRWRIVHVGDRVAVRDRRRVAADRPPTFASGARGEA